MSIEDRNYYNDYRVQAANRNNGLAFNEDKMLLTFTYEGEDGEERDIVFPAEFEVCPTCCGKGHHVNPAIDAGGISEDDEFWMDDYDSEGNSLYHSGVYDVECYQCGGRRVVPIIISQFAKEEDYNMYQSWLNDQVEYERECRMERMMGC